MMATATEQPQQIIIIINSNSNVDDNRVTATTAVDGGISNKWERSRNTKSLSWPSLWPDNKAHNRTKTQTTLNTSIQSVVYWLPVYGGTFPFIQSVFTCSAIVQFRKIPSQLSELSLSSFSLPSFLCQSTIALCFMSFKAGYINTPEWFACAEDVFLVCSFWHAQSFIGIMCKWENEFLTIEWAITTLFHIFAPTCAITLMNNSIGTNRLCTLCS